jgi:hypothetical protein
LGWTVQRAPKRRKGKERTNPEISREIRRKR